MARLRNLFVGRRPSSPAALPPDDRPAIELDLAADSDVLFVAFGGLAGKIGMPPFEFFRLAGDLPVKKVFLRDLRQAWYHYGLSDDRPGFDGVVEAIVDLRRRSGASRLVLFGNSAGGYAALAAGRLAGADEVHAISPQTFLSKQLRSRHGDERWPEAIERTQERRPRVPEQLMDLALLFDAIDGDGQTYIHYGAGYPLDVAHAERLAGKAGVELRSYDAEDHDLVRRLRDDGRLGEIVRGALG
jgi:pimeloyl-ACP methyl ester carboxylesterase